jgi:hypothetical protein
MNTPQPMNQIMVDEWCVDVKLVLWQTQMQVCINCWCKQRRLPGMARCSSSHADVSQALRVYGVLPWAYNQHDVCVTSGLHTQDHT